jgi:hypothetical protein
VNGSILPIGGASSGRVCSCSLRSRLVVYIWRNSLLKQNQNLQLSQRSEEYKILAPPVFITWFHTPTLWFRSSDGPISEYFHFLFWNYQASSLLSQCAVLQ